MGLFGTVFDSIKVAVVELFTSQILELITGLFGGLGGLGGQ